MVGLVLKYLRQEPAADHREFTAMLVRRLHHRAGGAAHPAVNFRHRKATLFDGLLIERALNNDGVHEHQFSRARREEGNGSLGDDEEPLADANLRRGDSDAVVARGERRAHLRDELEQRPAANLSYGNRLRLFPEHRRGGDDYLRGL